MNKYVQKFALRLINRRMRALESEALKKIRAKTWRKRKNAKIGDYIDKSEYRRLGALKMNIQGINNPWQGTFAGGFYWTRDPKNKKHIEQFASPQPQTEPEKVVLDPQEQMWADMSNDEFFAALEAEEGSYDNDYEVSSANGTANRLPLDRPYNESIR